MDSESNPQPSEKPQQWDDQVIHACAVAGQEALEVYLSKHLAFALYWESWSKPEDEE